MSGCRVFSSRSSSHSGAGAALALILPFGSDRVQRVLQCADNGRGMAHRSSSAFR